MYEVMVRLIVGAALLQLGLSISQIEKRDSRMCWGEVQTVSRKVLKIDWKPISVFPEEAKRFH